MITIPKYLLSLNWTKSCPQKCQWKFHINICLSTWQCQCRRQHWLFMINSSNFIWNLKVVLVFFSFLTSPFMTRAFLNQMRFPDNSCVISTLPKDTEGNNGIYGLLNRGVKCRCQHMRWVFLDKQAFPEDRTGWKRGSAKDLCAAGSATGENILGYSKCQ